VDKKNKEKRGQKSPQKNEKKRPKRAHQKKKIKNKKKRERGHTTIRFPHLCFKVAPCSSYRESPELLTFIY
jgi:hypothetical protein